MNYFVLLIFFASTCAMEPDFSKFVDVIRDRHSSQSILKEHIDKLHLNNEYVYLHRREGTIGGIVCNPLFTIPMMSTPLAVAVEFGHSTAVDLILQRGCDTTIKHLAQTALHTAVQYGQIEIVKLFIKYKSPLNEKTGDYGHTSLHKAALYKQWKIYKLLLEAGADASICDNHGRTATSCLPNPNWIKEYESRPSFCYY